MNLSDLRHLSNLDDQLKKARAAGKDIAAIINRIEAGDESQTTNEVDNMYLQFKLYFGGAPTPAWDKGFKISPETFVLILGEISSKTEEQITELTDEIRALGVNVD